MAGYLLCGGEGARPERRRLPSLLASAWLPRPPLWGAPFEGIARSAACASFSGVTRALWPLDAIFSWSRGAAFFGFLRANSIGAFCRSSNAFAHHPAPSRAEPQAHGRETHETRPGSLRDTLRLGCIVISDTPLQAPRLARHSGRVWPRLRLPVLSDLFALCSRRRALAWSAARRVACLPQAAALHTAQRRRHRSGARAGRRSGG